MNLERIMPDGSNYIVLKLISEFKKLYLCIDVSDYSMQTINTKAIIRAFDFKNINQFKGKKRFLVMSESEIIKDVLKTGSIYSSYELKLRVNSFVDYAGLNYYVLGFTVNNYAQWNIPTPLLLNPDVIATDCKYLFQGKMTDSEIIDKINDNFQMGKYDSEMLIPLVDANDYKEDIIVLENPPLDNEILLYIAKVEKDNNITITATKNVFIDTILNSRQSEIDKIRKIDENLYEKTKNFINLVNDIINDKIENKEKAKTKPEETDLSFLDELDDIFSDEFLEEIDNTF